MEDKWTDILHPFVLFLLELLKRFDSKFLTEVTELHPFLLKMKDVAKLDSGSPSRRKRQFINDFGELSR